MRKREPVIRSETPDDALGDYREKHPAFGQVSIHRVNHGPTKFALYGAASEHHMTTVRLAVSRSERTHNLSRDWYFAKGDLVEIEMTSLQFADLLTSFNMGSGVPCTIRYAGGETTPDIPVDDTTEIGRIKDGFKKKMEGFCSEKGIEAARREVKEILEKKSILKADRRRLFSLMEKLLGEIEHNVPFVMEQYVEAAARVESEVKKEITAFTNTVIEDAGIKALPDMSAEDQMRLLSAKGESDES